jgi:microcystin-dependent protein
MADTQTPNYGWIQPQIGGDPTTWGNILNNNTALIDAQVFANESGVPPVGSGALWFTETPPPNWLICDGSSLSTTTYNALFTVIGYRWGGSGANFNLPPLQNVFPFGAGALAALAASGGEAAHALTWAETGPHYHNVPDPGHAHAAYQGAHAHAIATGGHAHGVHTGAHAHGGVAVGLTTPGAIAGGVSGNLLMGNTSTVGDLGGSTDAVGNLGGNTDTQQPGVVVEGAYTGISTTDEQGSGVPHNNIPPFVAINFIIRYQ